MIADSLRILERLVAFPTVSSESNLDLIDYVSDLLSRLGARTVTTLDTSGHKANLFATLGPEEDGGVILSGHTDVVPTEGQEWTRDPYRTTVEGGRVYGRGTTDMKSFIACALAMAPEFAAAGPARPLHLALTYDEEVGCQGAKVMLADLTRSGLKPEVVILGEPTRMGTVVAHKGCYEFTTEIHGIERHASMSAAGAGAIHAAARFIGALDRLADELARRPPPDSPYDPPSTTINVGTISGGVARNITAGAAVFDWEIRPVDPGDTTYVLERLEEYVAEELLPSMQKEFAEASVTTTTVGSVGGFLPDLDGPALALARRVNGPSELQVVSFGTEAGLFQELGIAPVVCGPGDLDQAHTPDEFIEVTQLEACLTMLQHLLGELR